MTNKKDVADKGSQKKLIGEYIDTKFKEVLIPLYDDFQRWKEGGITHLELDRKLQEAHRQNQEIIDLLENTSNDILLFFIEEEKRIKDDRKLENEGLNELSKGSR